MRFPRAMAAFLILIGAAGAFLWHAAHDPVVGQSAERPPQHSMAPAPEMLRR